VNYKEISNMNGKTIEDFDKTVAPGIYMWYPDSGTMTRRLPLSHHTIYTTRDLVSALYDELQGEK